MNQLCLDRKGFVEGIVYLLSMSNEENVSLSIHYFSQAFIQPSGIYCFSIQKTKKKREIKRDFFWKTYKRLNGDRKID